MIHLLPFSSPGICGLRRAGLGMAGLLVSLSVVACQDSPTDPVPGLVAEESYAALALGVRFPDPEAWLPERDPGVEFPVLARWRASWDLPADEGRRSRELLYSDLALLLAPHLTPEALTDEVARLGDGVLRARALTRSDAPVHVFVGIEAAERDHGAARAAVAARDPIGAVRHLVRGGDALREVGPEAVARALVGDVEQALRRISDDDSYSQRDVERIRRLVRGGREAVDLSDWVLAIRRAYYARGLLDGNG